MQEEDRDNIKRHKNRLEYLSSYQMRRENFAETTEQLIATGIIHRWEA
jgi:hypothetical protein